MGQVLNACAAFDSETPIKLQKLEEENDELKKELLETQKKYIQSQKQLEVQKIKMNQLYTGNTKTTQEVAIQKQEKKKIRQQYLNENRRASQIEEKAATLARENEKLRQELTSRSHSAEPLQDGLEPQSSTDSDDNTNNNEFDEKDASPRTDMVTLRNWLVYKNLKEKDLKINLAKLLTARDESHLSKIPEAYKQRYGADIMDDISKIIKRGNVLELVDGLFKTRAEFDAFCIKDIVTNRSSKVAMIEVSNVVCCRSIAELKSVCDEYKKLYGRNMKDKIYKLSNGKTYQHIVNHMFDFSRNMHDTSNKMKIDAKIHGDVEYLMDKRIKWKSFDNKKKLALMVLGNNKNYVHDLNGAYFKKSSKNLVDFVDKQIGEKSTSGHWIKLRIEYCADPGDFYARKIQIAGDEGWNKMEGKEINRIFISTFGGELKGIQKRFNDLNYGDSKTMDKWVDKRCPGERYAFFLTKMLENAKKRS